MVLGAGSGLLGLALQTSCNWFCVFFSYKGLVAEALRQLVGEQNYKQDEVLPPGYYTGTTEYYCTSTRKYYTEYCTGTKE